MRIGSIIFLLLGLVVLGVGVHYLYVRFVTGPEPHLSAEDEQLRADIRRSQAELETQVNRSEAMESQLRAEAEKLPKDDPTGKRAKMEEVLATAGADRRKSADLLANGQKILEAHERLDALRDENSATALRRGILFTLLGLFWSVRAAASLREKPKPS